jgi:hypothetical protein
LLINALVINTRIFSSIIVIIAFCVAFAAVWLINVEAVELAALRRLASPPLRAVLFHLTATSYGIQSVGTKAILTLVSCALVSIITICRRRARNLNGEIGLQVRLNILPGQVHISTNVRPLLILNHVARLASFILHNIRRHLREAVTVAALKVSGALLLAGALVGGSAEAPGA